MFHVGFGTAKREAEIRKLAATDRTTGLILAAVHFEWMLKRSILKLGVSPTKDLRNQLEFVFRMETKNGREGYRDVWDREIAKHKKNAALGTVLGNLHKLQTQAIDKRGKVIHGNGTVSDHEADTAIDLFLSAGAKLRDFAEKHKKDLDIRLSPRRAKREVAST